MRNAILAQATGSALSAILIWGGVASLLLLALGGDEFEVGLVFMLQNVAFMIRLGAAPRLDICRMQEVVMRWQTVTLIVSGLLLVVCPPAMQLQPVIGRWAIIILLGFYFIARQMGDAAWMPLMSQVIPMSLRGRFFAKNRTYMRLVELVSVLLAGFILGKNPGLWQFLPVLGLGFLGYGLRQYYVKHLPNPEAPRTGSPETFRRVLSRPLLDKPFRQFLGIAFMMRVFPMLLLPFLVPYMVIELGVPSNLSVYVSAFGMGGAIMTLGMWGRITDKWGSRSTFAGSLLSLVLCGLISAFIPGFESAAFITMAMAALAFSLVGAASAGIGLAETVKMMRQSPHAYRGSYTTMVYAGHGLAGGLASVGAGYLLSRMPRELEVMGLEVDSKRLYFLVIALMLILSIRFLRYLPSVGEARPNTCWGLFGELGASRFIAPIRQWFQRHFA